MHYTSKNICGNSPLCFLGIPNLKNTLNPHITAAIKPGHCDLFTFELYVKINFSSANPIGI